MQPEPDDVEPVGKCACCNKIVWQDETWGVVAGELYCWRHIPKPVEVAKTINHQMR